jgi:hypothetical protein
MKTKGKIASKPARVVFNPHRKMLTEGVPPKCSGRNGLYAHFCYEYDEMLIDENDPEFVNCLCGMPNPKT